MNEYKIKIRDVAKVEKLQEESYQFPILQTRGELIDFLIRNKAYPYYSKTGKIFFRRLKKAEGEDTNFEGIIRMVLLKNWACKQKKIAYFLEKSLKRR